MAISRAQNALILRIMVCIFILAIFFMVSFGSDYFQEFFSQVVSSFPLFMIPFKGTKVLANMIKDMKQGIIYLELCKVMLTIIFGDIFRTLMSKAANLVSFAPLGINQEEINEKFKKTFIYIITDNFLAAVSSMLAVGYAYLISNALKSFIYKYASSSNESQKLFCVFMFILLFMAYVLYVSKKDNRSRINSFIFAIITEIPFLFISLYLISSIMICIYESISENIGISFFKCFYLFIFTLLLEWGKNILTDKYSKDENLDKKIGSSMSHYYEKFKYNPKTLIIMFFLYLIMIEVVNIFVMEGTVPDTEIIFIFSEVPFLNELMSGVPIANLLLEDPSIFMIKLGKLFVFANLISLFISKIRVPWIGDFIKGSNGKFSLWTILLNIMVWFYAVIFTVGIPLLIFIILMALSYIYPGTAFLVTIIYMFAMFYLYYMIPGIKGFVMQSLCNTLLTLLIYGVLTCTPRLNQLVHTAPIILWLISMVTLIAVGWFDKKTVR